MRRVIGIDGGPTKSAIVAWDVDRACVVGTALLPNKDIRKILYRWLGVVAPDDTDGYYDVYKHVEGVVIVALEAIVSYGDRVGASTFDTCYAMGSFMEVVRVARPEDYRRVLRLVPLATYASHFVPGVRKGRPEACKAAIIDRFGGNIHAAKRGPLRGISSHLWSALAVALYCADELSPPVVPARPDPLQETCDGIAEVHGSSQSQIGDVPEEGRRADVPLAADQLEAGPQPAV